MVLMLMVRGARAGQQVGPLQRRVARTGGTSPN